MFKELFKLCQRGDKNGKTPLENFVTEVFVGILQNNTEVRNNFIEEIGLPVENEYYIESQKFYFCDGEKSYIDIVIKDRKNQQICFIENKVNSKENPDQLKKYNDVLNMLQLATGIETQLNYLTKNYDPKISFERRKIKPLRWFEIADLLKKHQSSHLVKDFWNFLNEHNMTNDLSLNKNNIEVMEGFKSTIQTFNNYLNRLESSFKRLFCKQLKLKKGESTKRVLKYNRWIYCLSDILPKATNDKKIRSDFNYGFYFNESRLYVGLYINEEIPEYDKIVLKLEKKCAQLDLKCETNLGNNKGFIIKRERKISELSLDKDKADQEILTWFEATFKIFHQLFESSLELRWKF